MKTNRIAFPCLLVWLHGACLIILSTDYPTWFRSKRFFCEGQSNLSSTWIPLTTQIVETLKVRMGETIRMAEIIGINVPIERI